MNKEYIDKLENNLSTINKSAEILLNDLDNLNITLTNIDKYNKKGFKLNNIIKDIEDHIINTEKFLIELLEDTKKKSTNINIEANKISDNNNIFINMKHFNKKKNKNTVHVKNTDTDTDTNINQEIITDTESDTDESNKNTCCCFTL